MLALQLRHLITQVTEQNLKDRPHYYLCVAMFAESYIIIDQANGKKSWSFHCRIGVNT